MTSADLMERSPLDDAALGNLVQIGTGRKRRGRWVPSRYTIRAATDDGRLILWNSFTSSLSVFEAKDRQRVEELLSQRGCDAEESGLAAYLHERGFLVAEGTNEYRRIQYESGKDLHRSDVLELILLASEDCNFRCTYCYEDFERGTMRPEVRRGVRRLVDKRLEKLSQLRVSWFGGEPLYGFEAIEDLAPFFVERVEQAGIDFHSHMTTNGYLLTPELARRLFEWRIRDFQITIDGRAEDHDSNRPTRDGGGTFDTILSNLEKLAATDHDFGITIRVNFDQNNHPGLEEFLGLVENRFGADSRFKVGFHAVGQWGGPNDQDLSVCGTDEADQVAERLKRAALERGISLAGGLKEVRGPGAQVCYAARPYNFIVGADGQLMKCTIALDKKDYNVVGHLTEEGETVLDDDKMALWTEPAFEGDESCRKCVILPTCQGIHCPLIRIEQDRRPCPSLRLNLKREMRRVLEVEEHAAREVKVTQASRAEAV